MILTLYMICKHQDGEKSFETRKRLDFKRASLEILFRSPNRAPLKCKNEYLVLALGEETAVQAVVDFIVRAFHRLKKPRSREMRARGYALHSVCPQLYFFLFLPCHARVYSVHRRATPQVNHVFNSSSCRQVSLNLLEQITSFTKAQCK